MARVFIDTHELETAVAVRETVRPEGHEIEMVETAREIESRIRDDEEEITLFLTGDLERDGARAMVDLFSSRIPRPPVIGLAADLAADERQSLAQRLGLDDCLALPPSDEEVKVVLAQQLERYQLQLETGIIGRTEVIREVLERVHLIAPVKSTVLLTGESGTGKELVARAIHQLSPRRVQSFIAVNCAALPESLLESELFGHEKGAFTGATSRRKGMFELADGGTLLLDEISEMPPPLQTRLLRVLESRQFMRVGGETEIDVNVRVLAATNQDLRAAVQGGTFRRDLYYRLNVLNVHLPPLRERVEDIPVLVRAFVREFSDTHEKEFKGISAEAMEILLDYSWPGNVRELRNLVESMVVLAPGSVIRAEDIPREIRSGGRAMLPARAGASDLPAASTLESREIAERLATDEGRPELDFVFRTLVDLKLDVEELRREFARFKNRHPELLERGTGEGREGTAIEIPMLAEVLEEAEEARAGPGGAGSGAYTVEDGDDGESPGGEDVAAREGVSPPREAAHAQAEETEAVEGDDGSSITFRPGMSMKELEREAIVATLREVDGNRRRAAEKLEIGERTLYRKLKEYDIDL